MMNTAHRLPAYAVFAGCLAAAGLPIYIHAPKFFVDQYGVSLAALGAVLFGLRLLDVVQDPLLGWVARRTGAIRRMTVGIAATVMAVAMIGLFAITPPTSPLLWFGITLALLFSGYSFLTIAFYSQGVKKAERLGTDGHVRLAGWRETGALLGVSCAAVLPTVLLFATNQPFAAFAWGFAGLTAVAVWAMRPEWKTATTASAPTFRTFLSDPLARRLLLIAFFNAMPVAVSSTLFLFFVEVRLGSPGWEGPLLLLFFLSAAAAAPFWSRAVIAYGAKSTLLTAMVLAIMAFGGAALLEEGDILPFVLICILSGATMGADLTILPAVFANRAAEIAPDAAEGFGLWSFMTKLSLAFAAAILLPVLEASGFQSGAVSQPQQALTTLTVMYAVVPCALKLAAIAILMATPLDRNMAHGQYHEA